MGPSSLAVYSAANFFKKVILIKYYEDKFQSKGKYKKEKLHYIAKIINFCSFNKSIKIYTEKNSLLPINFFQLYFTHF
jgi:hypothetical protein